MSYWIELLLRNQTAIDWAIVAMVDSMATVEMKGEYKGGRERTQVRIPSKTQRKEKEEGSQGDF